MIDDIYSPQIHTKSYISKDSPEFSQYIPDISRIMGECFNNPYYVPKNNGDLWIMLFVDNLLIGFLMIDSDNFIWNVSVSENYRRRGFGSSLITLAICHIINSVNGTPNIFVDKSGKDSDKLIHMYEKLGFCSIDTDNNNTHMAYLV